MTLPGAEIAESQAKAFATAVCSGDLRAAEQAAEVAFRLVERWRLQRGIRVAVPESGQEDVM